MLPNSDPRLFSKGLRAAVQQTWPQAEIQRCTVHKLRNLLTTAPRRLHDELRADYHAIVWAEDAAGARRAYAAFCQKWGKACPRRRQKPPGSGCRVADAVPLPPKPGAASFAAAKQE